MVDKLLSKIKLNKTYIVDSKLQLIKDEDGIPCNDLIIAGTFLYVEPCEFSYENNNLNKTEQYQFKLSGGTFTIEDMEFDYLYL